jgi:SAM-dependent methyltransferase
MYESFPFPQRDKGHAEVGTVLANRLVDLGFSGRGRWLDLGCGTGEILTAAAERLPDTEFRGVDFSKTSLSLATNLAKARGLSNVECVWGDFRNPTWCDGGWDVVSALGTLHHLEDLKKAYADVAAALRPQGWFLLYHYGTYGRFDRALKTRLVNTILPDFDAVEDRMDLARKLFDLRQPDGTPLEDAWVADQYCNPCETTQTMREVYDLMCASGIEPVEWIGMSEDGAAHFPDPEVVSRYAALPRRERLEALDLLRRQEDNLVLAQRRDQP